MALDSTGDFFAADIVKGAALGALGGGLTGGIVGGDWKSAAAGAAAGGVAGAAAGYWNALQQQRLDQSALMQHVQADLVRENAQIDRAQAAFDNLTECRYQQAARIRGDLANGRVDRSTAVSQMALVKQRAQRDLTLAQQINKQIASRSQQYDLAADNISPGTSTAIASRVAPARTTTVLRAAALRLHPDLSASEIAHLSARDKVTVSGPQRDSYAMVTTPDGQRGYVQVADLEGVNWQPAPAPVSSRGGRADAAELRTLAGSNAARRDGFGESMLASQRVTATGFEIAG